MPEDATRVTYAKNGGKVTQVPAGTPKEEIKKARAEGRVDKNDPHYSVEDAKKDAGTNEDAADDNAVNTSTAQGAKAPADSPDADEDKDKKSSK